MKPINKVISLAMQQHLREKQMKVASLAEDIRQQQHIDIPEPCDRVHFDESESINSLENNRKRVQRWMEGREYMPVRIVPSILKVIGLFPAPELNDGLDYVGQVDRAVKEAFEAFEAFRQKKSAGGIEAEVVWQEGVEAILAILGLMLETKED